MVRNTQIQSTPPLFNLKERVQKNSVIKSAAHVYTHDPTNSARYFAQFHGSSAPLLYPYSHPTTPIQFQNSLQKVTYVTRNRNITITGAW